MQKLYSAEVRFHQKQEEANSFNCVVCIIFLEIHNLTGEDRIHMLRNSVEKDLKERCRFVDCLVYQSNSIVRECSRSLDHCPEMSHPVHRTFSSKVKGFSEQALRIVTRARLAAYEVGESYLMWKSLWPSTLSSEYVKQKTQFLSLKALAEKASGDCDRGYVFVVEVERLLSDKFA